MEIWPGAPFPFGAIYDGAGTNFSIFSEVADAVELCLFDDEGSETRVMLPERSAGFLWHGYCPGIGAGQRYGYRVHGPWDPAGGARCNPNKLLIDPYAKSVEGEVRWGPAVYGYRGDDLDTPDEHDSAPHVPRCVVTSPFFDWGDDRHPRTPWHETVIYELHVKGFTHVHPDVPTRLRGSYAGLAHPSVIEHMTSLGVTAVELMPVHQFVHDQALVDRGLRNYWGYNSIAYLAPHDGYSSTEVRGGQVQEFKQMVKAFHAANIEVILDVVYNHTAEGNHVGPTLSFRGIDNAAYYRLAHDDRRRYVDYTGCGNTLNMRHPHVLQLIMDSLRYWIQEMHVDGFRFDLAAALARGLHAVDRLSTFFHIIQQDPVISQVKLIAEPWDVGEGGYHVGNFPPLWSEWNGKYRDTVRDFWRGQEQTLGELASRLTGSSDLYSATGRRPYASVNFVTAHDGFTMRDLVSYHHKRNQANGEHNRDGESHNRSWNCGVEGETDDPEILALRARQQRNLLATILFSQGVPMLLAGDELGRTQNGNNNAYCQDSPISWLDWASTDQSLLEFVQRLVALRRDHPVFQRRGWFQDTSIRGKRLTDIGWFKPDGLEMGDHDWSVAFARSLAVYLDGYGIAGRDARGRRIIDDSFFMILSAHDGPLSFTIPEAVGDGGWRLEIDTARPVLDRRGEMREPGSEIEVTSRSLQLWRRPDRELGRPLPP